MKSGVAQNRRSRSAGPKVVVLLSGGVDSTATLAEYVRHRAPVQAVFFDYRQPARRSEWEAAQAVSKHYRIPLSRVRLGFGLPSHKGEFFGRNALLAIAAGAVADDRPLVIATGIHSGLRYYDTTASYVADLQRLFDGYAGGAVSLGAPFLEMTKPEIVKFARRHRVPLSLTYSCERRSGTPCGECPSCEDRKACRVD